MFSIRGQGEELVRILYRKNWDRILYHRIIQFRYFHCFYSPLTGCEMGIMYVPKGIKNMYEYIDAI